MTNNIYDPSPTLKNQPEVSPTIISHQHRKHEKAEFRIAMVNSSTTPNVSQGEIGGSRNFKSVGGKS